MCPLILGVTQMLLPYLKMCFIVFESLTWFLRGREQKISDLFTTISLDQIFDLFARNLLTHAWVAEKSNFLFSYRLNGLFRKGRLHEWNKLNLLINCFLVKNAFKFFEDEEEEERKERKYKNELTNYRGKSQSLDESENNPRNNQNNSHLILK